MGRLGRTTDSMDMNLNKLGASAGHRSLECCIHGVAKSRTRLSNWTTITPPTGPQWFNDVPVGLGRWDSPAERNPWGSCPDTWRMTPVVTGMSVIRITAAMMSGLPFHLIPRSMWTRPVSAGGVEGPENCLCLLKRWFQGDLGPYVLETIIWFIKTTH